MPERLDKERVARSFRRSLATYDREATVQREVGRRLLALLAHYPPINVQRVLEIGCCTGLLTELFCGAHRPGVLYLNDLVPEFAEHAAARPGPELCSCVRPLAGDIERAELPGELDLVLSSSTFQWVVDLPRLIQRLAQALKPGGQLAFALFGPGTLAEFRALTGVGLGYRDAESIEAALARDFVIEARDESRSQLVFAHPRRVLEHLRATGVGGVTDFSWTKSRLRDFEQEYIDRFGDQAGVPVSYVTYYFVARRRDGELQP